MGEKLRCSDHDCKCEMFTATAVEHVNILVDENGNWEETIDTYDSTKDLDDAECADCGSSAEWYDPDEEDDEEEGEETPEPLTYKDMAL